MHARKLQFYMNPLILCRETDDSNFIVAVNNLLLIRISEFKPNDLTITYIKNWFDSKWLQFCVTTMHEIAIWKLEDVTIPPFNPNRSISSLNFSIIGEQYKNTDKKPPLHISQASSDNLKRRIGDVSSDGIFIWYSSNSGEYYKLLQIKK